MVEVAHFVFVIGAAIAVLSLIVTQLIPDVPGDGNEIRRDGFWQGVNKEAA